MSSTTSLPTSSTSTTTPTPSDIDTYSFSIRETTIRNWAIGIGITLGILLVLCLIAIQVLRTKIKRLKKERDVYVGKLNGVFVHKGVKYEAVEPGVLEGGGLVVQRAELGSEEVFESGGRGVGGQR